ncbi:MAG: peptidoglycan DD-metalloendopeptidase family protein [Patescibacteria group bacterium]|nr:peptidoglycan DD-metalloendopeptidase family protein [Patescibacteria group bacterium]
MALSTIAANLNAYENRSDEFDQSSVVAALVSENDYGVIETEGPITTTKKITRYLGQTAIESKSQIVEQNGETPPPSVSGNALVQPILSPAEEALRNRNETIIYVVEQGDTISQIADKFATTINTILWENNLTGYSLIRPGDKLTILPVSGVRHKVARGETVASIAKKYGIDIDKILDYNKLASANDIKIGESLMIPGGAKIIATAPIVSYTAPSYKPPKATQTKPVTSSGKMTWPTDCRRITQYFHLGHTGIDIACGMGHKIYAADAGKIIKAQGGYNGGYGLMIIIDHGNGIQSLYGHLSKIYYGVGDYVHQGDLIAAMGTTGHSTGPHLHFEVRTGSVRRNPLYYVK